MMLPPGLDQAAAAAGMNGASDGGAPTAAWQVSAHTDSLLANQQVIFRSRLIVTVFAAALAGAFGLTDWWGPVVWLLSSFLLVGGLWLAKLRVQGAGTLADPASAKHAVLLSTKQVFTEGLLSSLTSFVLVWSLAYAAVHIYIS